jgi:hypothetical protein
VTILPDVIDKLKEHGQVEIYKKWCTLVKDDTFLLDNICYFEGTAKFIFDVVRVQFPLLVDPSIICPWFPGPDINLRNFPQIRCTRYAYFE